MMEMTKDNQPLKAIPEPEKPECLTAEKPKTTGDPDELFRNLLDEIRRYHPSDDLTAVERAYNLARAAHKEQKRKSGEPYIIHPICVAIVLAQLELDKEAIIAALLHDVVEDTDITLEQITEEFGEEVALLVDGVTKLTKLSWKADKVEIQAENLRKMFLAMAKDIRVILIKLADRLHNMRTLQFMTPEKQQEKARETLEIYAPIADRLGISKIKTELDDLSLKYLEPEVYEDLRYRLASTEEERERFIANIIREVTQSLDNAGIEAQISGRVKHIFSIYKKMRTQDKTLEQIYDLFAVRILVEDLKDCYAALGVIHERYKPIPGRFKDYIAMPKPNMYQSLHTTLISSIGIPFEIQIRTFEMHRTAEYGIAAHWKYKENGSGKPLEQNEADKMKWLREVLEWQKEMPDNKEFLSSVKNDFDLFSDSVYCFTPNGDVKTLPNGSTPIDFAYSIHSAVGNMMVGARVNSRLVPIDYRLQNGDRVEIITSQNSHGPSRDWLQFVRSSQARNKINQWFKAVSKEENIQRGKDQIDRYCKTKNLSFSDLNKPEYLDAVLEKYGFHDWDSLLAAVGHGGLKEAQIVNRLVEERDKARQAEITDEEILQDLSEKQERQQNAGRKRNQGGIVVKGVHDLAVHFSRCCNPVPGDEIIGFVTRGRGISIHRSDCVNMMNLPEAERVRIIEAEWQEQAFTDQQKYMVEIKIFANNRTGFMVDVSRIFTERGIDMQSMSARTSKQGKATVSVSFEVAGTEELNRLVEKLRQIPDVIDIERTSG